MRRIYLFMLLGLGWITGWTQTLSPSGSATFCAGGQITLTVNGAANGSQFQWRMDGLNQGGVTSSNTYSANASGAYSVIVTGSGTPDTLGPVTITQVPNPVANFVFPAAPVCSGSSVSFTSQPTGGTAPYSYLWNFDDGGTSTSANPSHTFTTLGCGISSYDVRLTVTDSKGCSHSVVKTINVQQAPDVQLQDQNIFSPFNNCSNSPTQANPTYNLTVNNISPSQACINSYNIDWGDGNTQNNVSFPLSHTYTFLGAFNLVVTAVGANGCTNSKTYVVANQSNPAGSLGTLGSTTNLCAPAVVPFTISNWTLNSPGTVYQLDFGDGQTITLQHPLNPGMTDDTIYHTYTTSSCPSSSYTATLSVRNACDNTPYTAGNIQIRIKPTADFLINASPSCVNQQVCFNNNTTAGSYGPSCNTLATYLWDFGDGSPTTTLENPCHTYSTPGVYTVTLSATNPCGTTTKTKTVCITLPPAPGFTLDTLNGCTPFVVRATDTTQTFGSCDPPRYKWLVSYQAANCGTASSYSFINGTADTSHNPVFSFANAGLYTITQQVTNACGTFTATSQVTVREKPKGTVTLPAYSCGVVTITPVAQVQACGNATVQYNWNFSGGTPATSNTANPGAITFSSLGTHLITLDISNDCGVTSIRDSVIVTTAPDVVVPPDAALCGGTQAGPFNFSSTIGTPLYNWTNNTPSIGLAASGTGNIPAFTAINNGTTILVAQIIVRPEVSNCSGLPDTFNITIYPKPAAPAVNSPIQYCQGQTTQVLTATASTGNTLTWYTNAALTGGSAIAPTPSSATAGNFTYYVTQSNSNNCASDPALINVVVHPLITQNTITASQNICANTFPNPVGSVSVGGGTGSYAIQWQSSPDGISWTNISGATGFSYSPPALSSTIYYRRIVASLPCSDTSNTVIITVQGALNNTGIAASQAICAGLTPSLLTGQAPSGGGGSYVFSWESSTDNVNWTIVGGATSQDYQPPALNLSTYYRRITTTPQCAATSAPVLITVHPTPVAGLTAVPASICTYDAGVVEFRATAGTAPFIATIVVNGPSGYTDTLHSSFAAAGPINFTVLQAGALPGVYSIQLFELQDQFGCHRTDPSVLTTITVKPLPVLVLSAPPTICAGVSTLLTASGAGSYLWSPATGLNSTTGSNVTASPAATTTYTVTGTLNGCSKDSFILVTVIPGAVVAAAGTDQLACAVTSVTLAANAPSANATGNWSQVSGPAATFTSASLNNTPVTNLQPGASYVFRWTITGQAPCPPTTDDVRVDVLTAIQNQIARDTIICNGETLTLRNLLLSGGEATAVPAQYSFSWEQSPNGLTGWQPVSGANLATLTVTPSSSTCYRRLVQSNATCSAISNVVCVTVNPTISNNVIAANQQRCVNTATSLLSGSVPTGGDNSYAYQWQTSTDQVNWTDLVTTQNYQPPVYAAAGNYFFRRLVSSGNCTSVSNTITITIHPDSYAEFTANPVAACAPFQLAPVIQVTVLPDSNGTYEWYADGALFGTNNTGFFPGYTISNPGDTIDIKLITRSQFGCKPDSQTIQFTTIRTAIARFTKDTGRGCSPLLVQFTNRTNLQDPSIEFFWDFGNGQTSTQVQPAPVLYLQSPVYRDTTYYITLKAYNGCDTTYWRDSVFIRTAPKARFGVPTTSGCSPFTVQISNTSLGAPSTYYWDFGNGHRDTTYATGTFSYTYNTGNFVDTFSLQLIAVNECGADTQTIDLRIAPNIIRPQININAGDLFGCTPHTVTFINSTSGASSYIWDFGDGTAPVFTNNSQTVVTHTYTTSDTFTVTVHLSNGCSDTTATRTVIVYPKPVAAFQTNAAIYCMGDTVRVQNQSLNASNYRWFWGDGQTSSGNEPTHVYQASGVYVVQLRAERTNANGLVCMDTTNRTITVLAKPDSRFQSNIGSLSCVPFTLTANTPAITTESVTWEITDTTVTPSVIRFAGTSVTYTFNKPGTFTIRAIAENILGCRDSTVQTFRGYGTPEAAFTPGNFSVCLRDTSINYINQTMYADHGPLAYRWLVDQVPQSTNGNFSYRYVVPANAQLPRSFTTLLIATNAVGCADTASATLQMNPFPDAVFSVLDPAACVPYQPLVTNGSADASRFEWYVNGVFTDTARIPALAITQPATPYTIRLVAFNQYGCKPDTAEFRFTSRIRPDAAFTVPDTLGCTGVLNVATQNQSHFASSYRWDWGDGSSNSTFTQPTHLYPNEGQYLITLIASDGVCTDTAQQYVIVSKKPVVDFAADNRLTCDTARVQFSNLTTGADQYLWVFSNGIRSSAFEPYQAFPPSNTPYTVKLVASNRYGCADSVTKANLITAIVPPAADFFISPSPTITVPNYSFSFTNLTLNSTRYQYLWDLGDGTSATTRDAGRKYADTGSYPIRLIVLDTQTNCADTMLRIARIDGYPGWLYVPNAICPNCIQSNLREFIPKGKGLSAYRLQVFTTWGELVFETSELDATGAPVRGWDGRFKGIPVQQDVYVWRIDARFKNGSEWEGMLYPGESQYRKTGTITVVR